MYFKNHWVINSRKNPIKMLYSLFPVTICCGILGIIRLHVTISTGDIVSKSKAFEYATNRFSKECKEVLHSAINTRVSNSNDYNPFINNTFTLRRRALDFMEYIIDVTNKIAIE